MSVGGGRVETRWRALPVRFRTTSVGSGPLGEFLSAGYPERIVQAIRHAGEVHLKPRPPRRLIVSVSNSLPAPRNLAGKPGLVLRPPIVRGTPSKSLAQRNFRGCAISDDVGAVDNRVANPSTCVDARPPGIGTRPKRRSVSRLETEQGPVVI